MPRIRFLSVRSRLCFRASFRRRLAATALRLASPSSPPDLGQRTFTSKLSDMLGTPGPVDAQTASTAPWKSLGDSHSPHRPSYGRTRRTEGSRPRLRAGSEAGDTRSPYRVAAFQTFLSGRI